MNQVYKKTTKLCWAVAFQDQGWATSSYVNAKWVAVSLQLQYLPGDVFAITEAHQARPAAPVLIV